eukprot:CAMPEP_0177714634 /NCGR_PEP_ID=MMETSP0484_2-20121128/13558_1 /TAXON_ID=354590 /ORGANISM="Rhodomonas lens, Strain RHODO" /LENGTH=163 /DNA_ID=CAMNT_0019226565 /DNA_START=486 /DNA_END=975 /DNA_ORIENTATION=-
MDSTSGEDIVTDRRRREESARSGRQRVQPLQRDASLTTPSVVTPSSCLLDVAKCLDAGFSGPRDEARALLTSRNDAARTCGDGLDADVRWAGRRNSAGDRCQKGAVCCAVSGTDTTKGSDLFGVQSTRQRGCRRRHLGAAAASRRHRTSASHFGIALRHRTSA